MNCTLCGKPIVLVPSAQERAAKGGGSPSDYSKLFTTHDDCFLRKRSSDMRELMGRLRREYEADQRSRTLIQAA